MPNYDTQNRIDLEEAVLGSILVEELFKGFRENWKFNCEECGKEVSEKELKEKTVECFKCKNNG